MLGKNHSEESKNKMSQIAKEKGFGSFLKGAEHPNAILNERMVKDIRDEYEHMTAPQLADKYGVSLPTIKHIVQRRSWKHVD